MTGDDPKGGMRLPAALRIVTHRPRYIVAILVTMAIFLATPGLPLPKRFLCAYDAGVLLWLGLVLVMMARSDNAHMQRRADEENAGALALLLLGATASIASLVAIAAELQGLKDAGDAIPGRLAIVIGTILASWLFVHTSFALHYAHEFYAGADDRRGLQFPKEDKPDYWDFLYFSFNLGAAAQTSDIAITARRMRRLVLGHTVLAFLFNTTILALAINVGASLL